MLGIGYDNGYARLLDQTVTQDTAVEIQLIEGPPLGWEINAMKLKKFQCKGVFSSENLDFYPAHTNNTAEPQSSNQADITSHPTSPSNPEFEAFQILRDFEPKPCYSLYLAGSCARRASCEKGHEFVLNAKQMQALATTAKTMRCKFGKDCWNRDKCFYSGHWPVHQHVAMDLSLKLMVDDCFSLRSTPWFGYDYLAVHYVTGLVYLFFSHNCPESWITRNVLTANNCSG